MDSPLKLFRAEIAQEVAKKTLHASEAARAYSLISRIESDSVCEQERLVAKHLKRIAHLHHQARQHGVALSNTGNEIREILALLPQQIDEVA